MEVLFCVENFGKIEHAEIALGNFTLFVGENNSGKTFMMQLLYGLIKDLHLQQPTTDGIEKAENNRLVFGEAWFRNLESQINDYLNKNKDNMIKKIFHRSIPIDKLSIRLTTIDETYECRISDYQYDHNDGKNRDNVDIVKQSVGRMVNVTAIDSDSGATKHSSSILFQFYPDMDSLKKRMAARIWKQILVYRKPFSADALFLPASRTGLQLLNKYFFAERDKRVVDEIDEFNFGDEDDRAERNAWENEIGLTSPVYDFLQFLLRYGPKSVIGPQDNALLKFIEEHLIDGRVKQIGEEFFYQPNQAKEEIPIYLASSLVNEIAPIVKVLSGKNDYRYIFYDEIETCLHPLKQGEMARLIIRLVNSGRRMVVSTHSDTMASKLNNLLLLSFSGDSEELLRSKIERLKLEKEDVLMKKNVHVYQFVNQPDGRSRVEELPFQTVPYVGYDFNLFMKNMDELYDETEIILE